jgi:hypothetical protein
MTQMPEAVAVSAAVVAASTAVVAASVVPMWAVCMVAIAASTRADTLLPDTLLAAMLPDTSLAAALLRVLLLDADTMAGSIMVTLGDIGMVGGTPTASDPAGV